MDGFANITVYACVLHVHVGIYMFRCTDWIKIS